MDNIDRDILASEETCKTKCVVAQLKVLHG